MLRIKTQCLFSDEKHRIRRFTGPPPCFFSDRGNSFPFVFRTEWKGDLKKERKKKRNCHFLHPYGRWRKLCTSIQKLAITATVTSQNALRLVRAVKVVFLNRILNVVCIAPKKHECTFGTIHLVTAVLE